MKLTREDIDLMRSKPNMFIKNVLGRNLWGRQKQIVNSVANNKITAVQSCHGAGKTFVASCMVLAWLYTRRNSVVITTAPTQAQVDGLLWKEIRVAIRDAKIALGGELMPRASELRLRDDWKAVGFTARDSNAMQGHHSEGGNLIVVDEAMGIRPDIWEGLYGMLTNEEDHMLCIGNPTDTQGHFYDLCRSDTANVIKISAYDLPNVQAGKSVIKGLTGGNFIEHAKKVYGEHSAYFQSRVLGEFPKASDNLLFPLSWVEIAMNKYNKFKFSGDCVLGCDIARKGSDFSVISEAYSSGVKKMTKLKKQDTMDTAQDILNYAATAGDPEIRIDADGLGVGVYDRVNQASRNTFEIRGGMSALDKTRFFNRRCEWYWQLRERLDPANDDSIMLPPSDDLRAQMSAIRWGMDNKNRISVESKKDMKKRGVKSPDELDAVVYSMATVQHRKPFYLV